MCSLVGGHESQRVPIIMSRRIAFIVLTLVLVVGGALIAWNHNKQRTATAVAQAVVGADQVQQADAVDNAREVGEPVRTGANLIEVPSRYQFGSVRSIAKADSDQQLLAGYSSEQQAQIRAFYVGFGSTGLGGSYGFDNVFSFKNTKQLEWLVKNGYPLPDDVLAASRMSAEELSVQARQGSFKAKVMLLAREYANPEPLKVEGAPNSGEMKRINELREHMNDVVADGSPFAGYVWVAEHRQKPVADGRAGVIAGYAYASTLGDARADEFMGEFARVNPGMSATEAISSYKVILSAASKNPQLANTTALMKRPRFQIF